MVHNKRNIDADDADNQNDRMRRRRVNNDEPISRNRVPNIVNIGDNVVMNMQTFVCSSIRFRSISRENQMLKNLVSAMERYINVQKSEINTINEIKNDLEEEKNLIEEQKNELEEQNSKLIEQNTRLLEANIKYLKNKLPEPNDSKK